MTAEHPPCVDRCTFVADLIVENAALKGQTERQARVNHNLTPEFVPPVPRTPTSAAARWMRDIEFTD